MSAFVDNSNPFGLKSQSQTVIKALFGEVVKLRASFNTTITGRNYTWWLNNDRLKSGTERGTAPVDVVLSVTVPGLFPGGVYRISVDGFTVLVASLVAVGKSNCAQNILRTTLLTKAKQSSWPELLHGNI